MKVALTVAMTVAMTVALLFGGVGAYAADASFRTGLAHLVAGEKERAASDLERAFDREPDGERRVEIASILSSFDQSILKKKLHLYAWYVLTRSKTLSDADRNRLNRVAGDSSFDSAQFEVAEKYFRALLDSSSVTSSDRTYGAYKLGWVKINQNQKIETWKLWTRELERSDSESLRPEIVHGLGRVWVELADEGVEIEGPVRRLDSLRFSSVDWKGFFEGFARSFRRKSGDKSAETQRSLEIVKRSFESVESLRGDPVLAGSVFARLITPLRSCEVLSWSERGIVRLDQTKMGREMLWGCARTALQTHDLENLKRVIKISDRFRTDDGGDGVLSERFARIDIYETLSDGEGLCREWLFVLDATAFDQIVDTSFDRAMKACGRSNNPELRRHAFDYAAKVLSMRTKDSGKMVASAVAALIKFNESGRAEEVVLARQDLKPELAAAVLDASAARDENLFLFVRRFGGEPMRPIFWPYFENWCKNQAASKRWDVLEPALEEFVPLNEVSEARRLDPWIALYEATGRPSDLSDSVSKPFLRPDQREIFFRKKLMTSDETWVWKHWRIVGPWLLKERMRTVAFLGTTLHRSSVGDSELQSAHDADERSARWRELTLTLRAALRSPKDAVTKVAALKKNPFWEWIKSTPQVADLGRVRECVSVSEAIERTQFQKGRRLEDEISSKIQVTRQCWNTVFSHRWNDPELGQQSKRIAEDAIRALATKIETVPGVDGDTQSGLKQIAEAVRDWTRGV